MRILLMEDEALIAMDVEQLCLDCGAADVVIARNLAQAEAALAAHPRFHAAIVDVMLGGTETTGFARRLQQDKLPFVFATGYTERERLFEQFPSIKVIGKPYVGSELVQAVSEAARISDLT